MVFSLVEAAQTWITEHAQSVQDQPVEEDNDEKGDTTDVDTFKPVLDVKASGGRWHFVIGLVVSKHKHYRCTGGNIVFS